MNQTDRLMASLHSIELALDNLLSEMIENCNATLCQTTIVKRVDSIFMRGASTMNLGACVGLKETIVANRPGAMAADRYPTNEYTGKSFFEGTNYRSALERLDGGYEIAIEFIEMMQEFCDQEKDQARRLVNYAEKWTTRLKQQSSLVSYHTTKRAQLDLLRVPRELAKLKESTCRDMQGVIEKYRHYINETYIAERLRPARRHRRSQEFKRAFKTAHSALTEVSSELDTLREQEKKAREALRTAESSLEIVELDPTSTEKQISRARNLQNKRRSALEEVQEQIGKSEEKLKSAQKVYRRKATEIFKQCQSVEEERLEHIRETLLDFIQAIHPTSYSTKFDELIHMVSERITKHQNSFDDLMFWAKSYGVDHKLTKNYLSTICGSDGEEDEEGETEEAEGDETASDTVPETRSKKKSPATNRDKHASHPERHQQEEENASAPVKGRSKRRKSISTNEKKLNEPGTQMNSTILNQV